MKQLGVTRRALAPLAVKFAAKDMGEHQEIYRLGAQTVSLPPTLESLLSYWLQKCDGRIMPSRDELPVHELRPWLGQLALIEIAGESDFRIRLSGTNLIRRFGREATALNVNELAGDIARQLRAILRAVQRAMAPVVAVSKIQLGRSTISYSEVALPLSALGGLSTVLLGSYPVREV